jgi:hypothetical protein
MFASPKYRKTSIAWVEHNNTDKFCTMEFLLKKRKKKFFAFILFQIKNLKTPLDILMYSGRRLMGSRLMRSFGYWDQIKPDFSVPKHSLVPN